MNPPPPTASRPRRDAIRAHAKHAAWPLAATLVCVGIGLLAWLSGHRTALLLFILAGPPLIHLAASRTHRRHTARDAEALHATERDLATTLQSIGDAVIACDKTCRVTLMNRVAESLTGWNAADATSRPVHEVLVFADEHGRRRTPEGTGSMPEAIAPLPPGSKLIRSDGSLFPVTGSIAPIRAANDDIEGAVVVFRDQTEEHHARQRLIEEEARYRTLIESSPAGIFHYDTALRITHLNQRFAAMLQMPASKIEGLDMRTLSDRRILPSIRDALEGRPSRYEGGYTSSRSGRQIWVTLSTAPVFNSAREISGGVGIMEDVTARHEAEMMMRESEARYALAMRGTNEGLWDWDPLSRSLFLSSRLLSVLGIAGEHVSTTSDFWLERIHPDDRKRFTDTLTAHLKGRTPHFESEYRVRKENGDYCWVLARGLAQRDANGIAYRMVGSIGDITQRVETETRMRDMNRQLEIRVDERTAQLAAALKELESFSYSVSHDLRTPLRAIDGYSAILAEDYADRFDGEAQELFRRMRAAVHRMGDLIDDLLKLARVSRSPLQIQNVDLSEMVASIVGELRSADPEREVELIIEPGLHVLADPNLIRIALENLLGNAWKFSARRTLARIRFGFGFGANDSGEAGYFVEDNGAGFDMRYRDKLFGPFQRLHNEREFEGTGIGLATVARIVQRHGGRTWATGAPDRGACFYFTLDKPKD